MIGIEGNLALNEKEEKRSNLFLLSQARPRESELNPIDQLPRTADAGYGIVTEYDPKTGKGYVRFTDDFKYTWAPLNVHGQFRDHIKNGQIVQASIGMSEPYEKVLSVYNSAGIELTGEIPIERLVTKQLAYDPAKLDTIIDRIESERKAQNKIIDTAPNITCVLGRLLYGSYSTPKP